MTYCKFSSYINKLKHNTQTTSAINKLKKVKAYEIHYIDYRIVGYGDP